MKVVGELLRSFDREELLHCPNSQTFPFLGCSSVSKDFFGSSLSEVEDKIGGSSLSEVEENTGGSFLGSCLARARATRSALCSDFFEDRDFKDPEEGLGDTDFEEGDDFEEHSGCEEGSLPAEDGEIIIGSAEKVKDGVKLGDCRDLKAEESLFQLRFTRFLR